MAATPTQEIKRLPCRGCTSDCKNYEFCDGKLWRQEPTVVHADKTPKKQRK
jgi:hypothetical protein